MSWFGARIDLATAPKDIGPHTDTVMDALVDYHPALGANPDGGNSVQISLQAETIRQAADLAQLAVIDAFTRAGLRPQVTGLEVLPEAEFLRRMEAPDVAELPELVGTNDAAEILGVSAQRVVQLAGRMGGKKIGKTLVFPRAGVEAFRASA